MKRFLPFALLIAISIALISWGVVGHKTVATIAENHLTTRSQTVVKYLLGDTTLADIASWADQVLREPEYKNTAPQHYLNLPLGLSYNDFQKAVISKTESNVYQAVGSNVAVLKDPKSTKEERAIALKFLVHFVGDLHQPMHISRKEDKGGNTIQVQYEGKGTNLHSLWDSKLIGTEGKTFNQMAVDYDKATPAKIKQWQGDSLIKWLWESYQISSRLYAEIEINNKLNDAYYNKYIGIVHERIEMAGVRLAGLLNEIFASATYTNLRPKIAVALENMPRPKQVSLEYAASHIGETVSVIGKVVDQKEVAGMMLLNMGAAYPNQVLTIVLKGNALDSYKKLACDEVGAIGKVVIYKGKPEIMISDPNDLICKSIVY